jgi:hypothetical protein
VRTTRECGQTAFKKLRLPPIVILEKACEGFGSSVKSDSKTLNGAQIAVVGDERNPSVAQALHLAANRVVRGIVVVNLADPVGECLGDERIEGAAKQMTASIREGENAHQGHD